MRIPSQLNYALEVLGMPHCLVDFSSVRLSLAERSTGTGYRNLGYELAQDS
jgi:hypothetical protein